MEVSLPKTLLAKPCKEVHDFPQSPDSEFARSLPLLKLSLLGKVFRDPRIKDEERDGCALGSGDGSLVTKGDSGGEMCREKSLENSSKPVRSLLLRGLSEAVFAEDEPVREWVTEPGLEPFIAALYR